MEHHTDTIIETILKHLPKDEKEWELVGFINKDKEIYPFGNDSKIIGRLFEVVAENAMFKASQELGFELHAPKMQTVYPDFFLVKPNGKKIAIDVKTTYRVRNSQGNVKRFSFTGGSFTSYMRNGTKNIEGNYSEYDNHYILGILYTREISPTIGKQTLDNLQNITPSYHSPEVFIQEKYRIVGDKKGSGNTDNIGTIKSNTIEAFRYGAGPFAFLGKKAFNLYWTNHPLYKDSSETKQSLFSDIPSFILWLRATNNDLADEYEQKYHEYIEFRNSKGW
ncbi:restriction endonuclease [Listeria innocua]|nr:restriction endonuclease [Listeria innocua]EIU0523730.1 restriction endonuclease [Listeria innocua]